MGLEAIPEPVLQGATVYLPTMPTGSACGGDTVVNVDHLQEHFVCLKCMRISINTDPLPLTT